MDKDKIVKIYTTQSCVYCKMAKEFFKTNGIEYAEYDVAANEKARNEMIEKSRQLGVPVIEINGEVFVGFDKNALVKALNIKK